MVFASRGGALFAYTVIWAFIVSAVAKAALTYSMNRYLVVTGERPVSRWTTLFRGPRGWFTLLMGVVSISNGGGWSGTGWQTGVRPRFAWLCLNLAPSRVPCR